LLDPDAAVAPGGRRSDSLASVDGVLDRPAGRSVPRPRLPRAFAPLEVPPRLDRVGRRGRMVGWTLGQAHAGALEEAAHAPDVDRERGPARDGPRVGGTGDWAATWPRIREEGGSLGAGLPLSPHHPDPRGPAC